MSSLKQQLKAIQEKDRIVSGIPAGSKVRPSFLFDPKEAATYEDRAIYDLAMGGLQELQAIDESFYSVGRRLFEEEYVNYNISLFTKKVLEEEIRPIVSEFLLHLSPHFELRSTHMVFEWLVRRWRVNEVFVDELLVAILPFHETVPFVRMMQIVFFTEKSMWKFLEEKCKNNGETVSRKLLAQRSTVESRILLQIYKAWGYIQKYSIEHPNYPHCELFSKFSSLLLIEAIGVKPKLDKKDVIRYFQHIYALVSNRCLQDHAAVGACIALMELSDRSDLALEAIENFFSVMNHRTSEAMLRIRLLTLVKIVENGSIHELSPKLIEMLETIPSSLFKSILGEFRMVNFIKLYQQTLSQDDGSSTRLMELGITLN